MHSLFPRSKASAFMFEWLFQVDGEGRRKKENSGGWMSMFTLSLNIVHKFFYDHGLLLLLQSFRFCLKFYCGSFVRYAGRK